MIDNSYEKEYKVMHSYRIEHLISSLWNYAKPDDRIGIIGYSMFDDHIRETFKTMVFYNIIPNSNFIGNDIFHHKERIFIFDVAQRQNVDVKFQFDILIFTEVLEHIFADDSLIISNVSKLIRKNGLLFFSVPNVSAFGKLIPLLIGENPYMKKEEIINGSFGGFGHIREYSFREVKRLLSNDFQIVKLMGWNDYPNTFDRIAKILPKIYAETIFAVCLKK